MTSHVVTGPCVVAKLKGAQGGEQYFYSGAVLPHTVSAAEKQRLVETGLVTAVEDPVAVVIVETPVEPPAAPVVTPVSADAAPAVDPAPAVGEGAPAPVVPVAAAEPASAKAPRTSRS